MLSRIVKEPLLHFLLLGGAIFMLNAIAGDTMPEDEPDTIVVTSADLDQLRTQFQATWRRQPTEDELARLVQGLLREEILVREALALGMEQNDTVIRRRLVQKMEFFAASAVAAIEPQEATLRTFYEENAETYRRSPRYALTQVFLGPNPSDAEIEQTLAALETGGDPLALGQRTMLPGNLPLSAGFVIDGSFGQGFSQALAGMPQGEWGGPVRSGFGYHLVRLDKVEAATLPPLDELRGTVLQDWQRQEQEQLLTRRFETLRDGYQIILPDTEETE